MLYPIIDIGSNTVKLAVLDSKRIFASHPVYFKAVPLGLKAKTEHNRLTADAIEELGDLLKEFSEEAARLTPQPPLAFATASLRGLENEKEVLDRVLMKSGVAVEVISGEQEAYYSFLGARRGAVRGAGIEADLGGGSMELVSFRGKRICQAASLPIGCLTLYHTYFENEKEGFDDCRRFVRKELQKAAPPYTHGDLLLTGGSAKAILKYKNILENKRSLVMGKRQMRRILAHYRAPDARGRDKIESVLKDRYLLVLPALAVFLELMDHYGQNQVTVCRSGVREGRLYAYLKGEKEENSVF